MHNCPLKGSGQALVVPKSEFCPHYGHRTEYCWEKEENAYRRPTGWTSILPVKAAEDAALVSFSLSAVDNIKEDEENTVCEDVGAVVVPLTTFMTEMPDKFAFSNIENGDLDDDDDDIEPPVQLLPLETTSVAYAPPAVYRTPTGETVRKELVDSEDDMDLDPDFDDSEESFIEELDGDFYDCRDEEMTSLSHLQQLSILRIEECIIKYECQNMIGGRS